LTTLPWKVSKYDSVTSSWQCPQVLTVIRMKPAASVRVISCDVWQSSHMGSSLPSSAWPVKWMLPLKVSKMPWWHCAQVSAMRLRLMLDSWSACGRT
jgi:hypothetical protein